MFFFFTACQKITFSCDSLERMADIINSKIGEQQSLIKKEEEDKRNFESYLQKLVLDLTQMKFKVTELKTLTERSTKENGICEKKIFFFSFFFWRFIFFF